MDYLISDDVLLNIKTYVDKKYADAYSILLDLPRRMAENDPPTLEQREKALESMKEIIAYQNTINSIVASRRLRELNEKIISTSRLDFEFGFEVNPIHE